MLEWNEGTQHFEIVDFMEMGPTDLGMCTVGMTVLSGRELHGHHPRFQLYFYRECRRTRVYKRHRFRCN